MEARSEKAFRLETYNNLVSELGSSSAGYNSNTNYLPGVEFYSAVHDPTNTLYQDLAIVDPVPEPSSLAIATLGALALIGYGWRRRAQSMKGTLVPSTFPWYRRVGGPIQSWRVGGPIQSRRFCRAPSLITIGEAIPPPRISKVAENSPNPDRLS